MYQHLLICCPFKTNLRLDIKLQIKILLYFCFKSEIWTQVDIQDTWSELYYTSRCGPTFAELEMFLCFSASWLPSDTWICICATTEYWSNTNTEGKRTCTTNNEWMWYDNCHGSLAVAQFQPFIKHEQIQTKNVNTIEFNFMILQGTWIRE